MIVTSPDWIKINGVKSDTFNLYVDTPPLPPLPATRYNRYNVGADQDKTYADGGYDDITITVSAYIFDGGYDDINDINNYIANAKTLEISRLNDYYFKVKEVKGLTPSHVVRGKHRLNISFVCEPFRYSVDGIGQWVEPDENGIIKYYGTHYGEPLIEVKGTGDVQLVVGAYSFKINDMTADEAIIIDCSRKIAYIGNQLINYRTQGVFPKLHYGDNEISFFGDITSLRFQTNERWL